MFCDHQAVPSGEVAYSMNLKAASCFSGARAGHDRQAGAASAAAEAPSLRAGRPVPNSNLSAIVGLTPARPPVEAIIEAVSPLVKSRLTSSGVLAQPSATRSGRTRRPSTRLGSSDRDLEVRRPVASRRTAQITPWKSQAM